MKTQHPLILILVFLCLAFFAKAQSTPAIIADWMDFAGISDTLTVIPIAVDDSANVISVGVMVNDTTGPDILISKVDSNGADVFKKTFSSSGFNRDQAVAVTVDDKCSIYIAGVVYSSATNFDWIILKYGYDGTLEWTYTLNGTANNYDVPAAIKIKNSLLYVTGEVYDSVTQLNYATIQLNRTTGALNWKRQYDFHSLNDIAFAMDISETGIVKIAGASQDNLTKWNYCSLSYDSAGVANDTTRISGTANSFDRPMAVKCDALGNFYITGAGTDSAASFNARTVKIDSLGNVSWMVDYGSAGRDDEGNDLLVDDSGYVYVSGKSYPGPVSKDDYLLVKYNNSGTEQWHVTLDADSSDDAVNKMCFDSYGNIILTGKAKKDGTNDFRTVAYSKNGDLLWSIYFDGQYGGDDQATGITADANGNIFVSGESQVTDSTYQKVTIKYKTDYFLVPQDTVPAPSSLLFYPNSGQIIDTEDSVRYDVSFYSINQFPKLYFHQDSISFVMARVDGDTATADTLERITMNFAEGNMAYSDPFSSNTHDTDQVLNYFLGNCPDGITGITGSEKIMYSEVYKKTDVIFSNNNAGMKFQIIMNPDAEPQAVLHFTGHQSLQLVNNSDLQVSGVLGSFTYERPLVYQLDFLGNRISLGWLASYYIVDSADVAFQLPGSYDHHKPLVIECARAVLPTSNSIQGNCDWSTWIGGNTYAYFVDAMTDYAHNKLVVGTEFGNAFPLVPGAIVVQSSNQGGDDAIIAKFNYLGQLKWTTYVGGTGEDYGQGITMDSDHHIYIVGHTQSSDFPVWDFNSGSTSDYYQPTIAGSTTPWDGFIFELGEGGNPNIQTKIWGTYFGGGAGKDWFEKSKIDGSDNLFVVGNTNSNDFPVPASQPGGAYLQPCSDYAVLSCTTSTGSTTVYTSSTTGIAIGSIVTGTGIAGTNTTVLSTAGTSFVISIAATASGIVNLTFSSLIDGVIVKFDSDHILKWSTCYGGGDFDYLTNLDIDQSSNVFAIGNTLSLNLPTYDPNAGNDYFDGTLGGKADAIILKFSNNGARLYATYYGGNGDERGVSGQWEGLPLLNNGGGVGGSLAFDAAGDIFFTGTTTSSDNGWLLNPGGNAYYQSSNHGNCDAWLAEFTPGLARVWGTFYGGGGFEYGNDISVDNAGIIYLCGTAHYYNTLIPFPSPPTGTYTQTPAGNFDCFITAFTRWGTNIWGTVFGGTSIADFGEKGICMTVDNAPYLNQVVVYGGTTSTDFVHEDPGGGVYIKPSMVSGARDASITRFTTDVLHSISINVNEIAKDAQSLSIFPNPANELMEILFENKIRTSLTLIMFNMLGEEIKKVELGNRLGLVDYSLNISDLPSGIYNVIIEGENVSLSKKLIKL